MKKFYLASEQDDSVKIQGYMYTSIKEISQVKSTIISFFTHCIMILLVQAYIAHVPCRDAMCKGYNGGRENQEKEEEEVK